jgi:hypothetical protein
MRIQAFLVAIALFPSLAKAADAVHLAPSSPWVVDYAENSCRLARRFGTGKDLTTLAFESEAPGSLDMLVIGKPLGTFEESATAGFLPLQSKPFTGTVARTTDRGIPSILFNRIGFLPDAIVAAEKRSEAERRSHPEIRPPGESLATQASRKARRLTFAASVTGLEVEARHNHPVILDTGSLGEAIKALDECSRDSLRDWGVDPDLEDKIVRSVWAPNPSGWFSPLDYPREMLVQRRESVVKVRALVDATGKVTKCTTISHFKEPEFDRITCERFMAKAHFEPAELADGTKVPSYYVNKVVFRIAK